MSVEMTNQSQRIFEGDKVSRQVVLPWKRTLEMCWSNVENRMGRSTITFAGIVIVVAFFMSTISYQTIIKGLFGMDDVHVHAVLERAGMVANDTQALTRQEHRKVWLLGLSGLLSLAGITNTMLMSVTERFREIGTLKCLGALDRFVVRLFMIESFLVGLLGSLIGTLLGFLLMMFQVATVLEFTLPGKQLYFLTFFGCGWIAVVGGTIFTVLAAVYPTYVAAKMKPVDAMRSEI